MQLCNYGLFACGIYAQTWAIVSRTTKIASEDGQYACRVRAAELAGVEVEEAAAVLPDAAGDVDKFDVVVAVALDVSKPPEVAVVTEPSVPVKVTSTASVIAGRIGVAVPALSGAGVLGVKSGMLLQFWFCKQYDWDESYCQLCADMGKDQPASSKGSMDSCTYTRSLRSTGIQPWATAWS